MATASRWLSQKVGANQVSGRPIWHFWVSADTDIIGRPPIPIPIYIGRYLPTKTWISKPLFKPFYFQLALSSTENWAMRMASPMSIMIRSRSLMNGLGLVRLHFILGSSRQPFINCWTETFCWYHLLTSIFKVNNLISVHIFHYIYFWISIKNMSK